MENMTIWNAVKQVPPQFLKQIRGGRLQGMSDVNPQWRYQAMTEQFGLCGVGWKWELRRIWTEPALEEQVFAFAEVAVYHKSGNAWSDPIPGIGGSMLIEKETKGLHLNDEGYKMAITDALGTALKFMGIAADVYAGLWDGSKYRETKEPEKAAPCNAPTTPKTEPVKESVPPKTEADPDKTMKDYIKQGFEVGLGITEPTQKSALLKEWGFTTWKDLPAIKAKLDAEIAARTK